ncbi:MAG: hypothetical protein A2Z20_11670 [Bdellovibrionales bacterium RBG_16_40_8]|nr:MAG: hypothetical protein A2Z20_11670 [Bdellovibrionales bacterium RBG_16_40_8]
MFIVSDKIDKTILRDLCDAWFGQMVKIVVDIEREIIALGGQLHADAEYLLIQHGSRQVDVWGANYYPFNAPAKRIEYTALINIRPHQENPAMEIASGTIKKRVESIVKKLLLADDEELV